MGLRFSVRILHFIIQMGQWTCLFHLQVSSRLAKKELALPATMWVIWPGPQKAKAHPIFPRVQALCVLFTLQEALVRPGLNPPKHVIRLCPTCPAQLRTCMVLPCSTGPGNNIPEDLLSNDHHPLERSRVVFSSVSPKALLPTFCKFIKSEKFILDFCFFPFFFLSIAD